MTNHPNRSKITDWPAYLRGFRKEHGLTHPELAELLPTGTTARERTIQDWEKDDASRRPT